MKLYAFFLIVFSLVITMDCGKSTQTEKNDPSDFLVDLFIKGEIQRISESRSYIGSSLYEYINGGAELYHKYEFTEVATADYKKDSLELVIDIYKFADPEGSFGLYSMLRPANPNYIDVGVEGYSSSSSLEFTKGEYIIRIMSYVMSEESQLLMEKIAGELEKDILNKQEYPKMFTLFVNNNTVAYTKKIYSQSFLGYNFLTDVYKQDCIITNDTFHVFLAYDEFDQKFNDWSNEVEMSPDDINLISGSGFDNDRGIMIRDTYYGDIIVGRKNNLLIGIINFKQNQFEYLNNWLKYLDIKYLENKKAG